MHTLRAQTLQGLILSCRNFTWQFARELFPKQWPQFYWFFVDRVLLIILLRRTIFWNLKSPKLKYLQDHFFGKISAQRFEDHICTNRLEPIFFWKIFFQGLGAFLTTAKLLIWALFFFKKKLFYSFFQV